MQNLQTQQTQTQDARQVQEAAKDMTFVDTILEALYAAPCVCRESNGDLSYSIYADYRDTIDEQDVTRCVNSNEPEAAFYCLIEDAFCEVRADYEDAIITAAIDHIAADEDALAVIEKEGYDVEDVELRERIQEILWDYVRVDYPFSHFEEQEIDIVLALANDGAEFFYDDTVEGGKKIEDESGIKWLIEQQGYTLEDLRTKPDNKFLTSCRDEIEEAPYDIGNIVFALRTTVKNFMRISQAIEQYEDDSSRDFTVTIEAGENAYIGLFSPFNGSGSILEIIPEKDVTIPACMIAYFKADSCIRPYGLKCTYGMMEFNKEDIKLN